MASIKKNFAYNAILTTANYIFPIIVFPYVSRVLGVNNIGICNYVDSIIQNFILVSMMGIGIVGIREVVAVKNDRHQLNRTFSSIFYLNAVLTAIAAIILLSLTIVFPEFREHKKMMLIGLSKLIGNFLMIEWFFKGIEDFKYITARSILVRLLFVLAVFLLINDKDDYGLYFALTCSTFVLNAAFNLFYARKFVSLTTNPLPLAHFLKPILILGVYLILTNLYISFNTMWLGIETDDTQVGYFTTATKLYTILVAIFTAFTTVMLPRMSDYLCEGNIAKFREMLTKSLRMLLAFVIPLVCYGIIFADDIVTVIAGPGYEGAVLPMQLCMPLLIIIGYEQIIIVQGLMPMKKDRAIFINSLCGGFVAITLCLTIIAPLKAVGASIVWIASEITVTISASIFFYRYLRFKFPWPQILSGLLYNIPLLIALYFIHAIGFFNTLQWPAFASALTGGLLFIGYTFVLQYFILKEPLLTSIVDKWLKKK